MIRRKWFVVGAVALLLVALFGVGWLLLVHDQPRTASLPEPDRTVSAPAEPQRAPERTDPLIAALNRAAQGDLEVAREEIEALHQAQPNAPGPYLGLAEIAVRKGDMEGADAWLSKGLAVAPNVSELYRARGRLLLLQKKDEEARATFDKAIELAPRDVRPRIELADLYATRFNQPEKAVDSFKDALGIDPGNAAASYGLGVVLARLKRTDEAKAALNQAQKLAPKNPMPSFTLGQVYVQERRYTDALAAFDMALLIQPKLLLAHFARGEVLQGTQRYDEAIAEYRKILEAEPKSARALLGIAMAHQAAGREAEAFDGYKAVVAVDPNQPIALNNLAWISATRKSDLDEALGWAKKAVDLTKGQAPFRDTLGWVHYHRGELTEATQEFELALQQQPTAITYVHLGTVRAALGDKEAATAAFRKALDIAPNYQPALDGLQALR